MSGGEFPVKVFQGVFWNTLLPLESVEIFQNASSLTHGGGTERSVVLTALQRIPVVGEYPRTKIPSCGFNRLLHPSLLATN